MDYSSDKWFRYLKENVRIDEGVRDIGLTEMIADFIESALQDAPESAKTWMGHMWKRTHLHQLMPRHQMLHLILETEEPLLSALNYYTGGMKRDELEPPKLDVQFESILNEGVEWSAEKADRTKQVIKNIRRTIKDEALGKWPRAFKRAVKNLSKLGLKSEVVEFVQEVLQNVEDRAWKTFETRFRDVFIFLNMHPDNIRVLDEYILMASANEKAEEELEEMDLDPDKFVIRFDDGAYWYDLQKTSCDIEARRMGHCGAAQSGGTIYSLRRPEGKRGKSKSYVTIEADGDTIYQIKGKGNSAPPEETWDAIVEFIDDMGIENVQEKGDYSDNPEDFQYMNDYLDSRTDANFAGNRQARVDELENELDNLGYELDGLESSEVYFEISEYGEDENQIYVNASVEAVMTIDLGWPMFFETKGGYIAMDREGNPITGLQMIPTTYSQQNDFVDSVGIDDVADALPGELIDIELDFQMREGTAEGQRGIDDPDYEPQETAHMIVTIRKEETFEDYEREGGNSAAYECSQFQQSVQDDFDEEDVYKEHVRSIQAELQAEEYMKQSAYVKDMQKLRDINDLKHWSVYVDSSEAKLSFIDENNAGQVTNKLPTGLALPTEVMIYRTAPERTDAADVVRMMFPNYRTRQREVRAPSLNAQMATRLNDAYGSAQRAKMAASGQEEFDFGPQYEAKPAMELAKDIELVIYPKIRYDVMEPNRVPTLSFDFFFQIRVGFDDDVEEIDRVLAMAEHINENPTIVREAVRDIIAVPMSELNDGTQARKSRMLNPNTAVSYYNEMDSKFGASAAAGNDDDERRMLIAMWIRDNYAQMDDLEKFVAYYKYISPMLGFDGQVFRIFGNTAAINPDTGEPRAWWDLIQNERQRRGVGLASREDIEQPVNESIEDQIARIDALLNERQPIDLRIYKVDIGCKLNTEITGTDKQIEDQIRGINKVTTVRHLSEFQKQLGPDTLYRIYQIKFEMHGQGSRDQFRDLVLIPAINSKEVAGVNTFGHVGQVQAVDNPLREYAIGTPIGAVNSQYSNLNQMTTPRPALQTMIDDWSEGGVQMYDMPVDYSDGSGHVMMPVEELSDLCSREYRSDMRDFRGRYQHFIRNGAELPVFLAIGQNGRAKITGNEDLVWFALKSGLEELPVFIRYQKQV